MGTERILFLLCFSVLVYGYTPTFRNEATHPLKAPTESTLGLQNDELVGRTKSNIPKQETFFSGGKHFEYMLLNDSSVLLTSLQNDGPYDAAPEQAVPTKDDLPPKSNDHIDMDEIIKPRALPSISQPNPTQPPNALTNHSNPVGQNGSLYPTKKTNFKINSTDAYTSSHTPANVNFPRESPFNFPKVPDISSTTKLYSKHANSSEESFASFTSPVIGKSLTNEIGDLVLPKMNVNPSQQRQIFDYDDSFTKLLISNGILKPDNATTEPEVQTSPSKSPVGNANSNANPSVEDINRIMDSSIASIIRNNTDTKSAAILLRTKISQNLGVTLEALTKSRIVLPVTADAISVNMSADDVVNNTDKDPASSALESNRRELEVSSVTSNDGTDHVESSTDLASNIDNPTRVTTAGLNENDASTFASVKGAKMSANDSSVTQLDKINVVLDHLLGQQSHNEAGFTQLYETTERKSIPLASAGSVHTDVSNENPLAAKTYTDSTTIFDSSPLIKRNSGSTESNDETASTKNAIASSEAEAEVEASVLPRKIEEQFLDDNLMPYSANSPHEVMKKNYRNGEKSDSTGKVISLLEFRSMTDTLVENLFYPVAKYFNDHVFDSKANKKFRASETKVSINRFGYVNVGNVLDTTSGFHKFKKFEENVGVAVDGGKNYNWIDLKDGKDAHPHRNLECLFFDEETDARWFALLLDGNASVARLQSSDFVRNFTSNLAIRLQLEYRAIKINTVIIIPPCLATNVSVPADLPWINTKEELEIVDRVVRENDKVQLLGQLYQVWQFLSKPADKHLFRDTKRIVNTMHDDIELFIFVLLGAICTFVILSLVFYGVYRLIQNHTTNLSFKVPVIFRDRYQYHEKLPDCRSESLNVIFSENFDRKYTTTSWLDNTHHSSSILKASSDVPPTIFAEKGEKFSEFGDNPVLNSPRLNKENKLNVLGCRPSCVLLPHSRTYLDSENNERCFDNPNYDQDAR